MTKDQPERKTKASSAPRCRTCGKSEWRHLCLGAAQAVERVAAVLKRPVKLGSKGKAKRAAQGRPA
jgi:hypothetical protein